MKRTNDFDISWLVVCIGLFLIGIVGASLNATVNVEFFLWIVIITVGLIGTMMFATRV